MDFTTLEAKWTIARTNLAAIKKKQPAWQQGTTVPTLEFYLMDLQHYFAEFQSDPEHGLQLDALTNQLLEDLNVVMTAGNPWKNRRGHIVRAYWSPITHSPQPYSLYIPPDYNDAIQYPLVISLHGAYSNHFLNLRRVFGWNNQPDESDQEAKRCMPPLDDVPYIVLSPNGYGTMGYEGLAEDDIFRTLQEVQQDYNIDADRIYLTGLSMGGNGTWLLALRHPHLFAAIAPVCGYVDYSLAPENPNPTPDEQRFLELVNPIHLVENLQHIPIKIFHGAADEVVPVEHSRRMYQKLTQLGNAVEYTEYPEVGHAAWEPAYEEASIFDEFEPFKRQAAPPTIRFKTNSLRYNQAYWLRIDAYEAIYQMMEISASIQANRVTIQGQNIRSFSLKLDPALIDFGQPLRITFNDQIIFEGLPYPSVPNTPYLRFTKSRSHFVVTTEVPEKPALIRLGIPEFFATPQKYVVGQGSTREINDRYRQEAHYWAHHWRWESDIIWPILTDTRLDQLTCTTHNLLLFGRPRRHSLMAKIIAQLPVSLFQTQIKLGSTIWRGRKLALRILFPNPLAPAHYILWQAALDKSQIPVLRKEFTGQLEYVIFRDGEPIVNSHFDEYWQVK
ncbi:prolyl oligopeptidase family serine peptidase [candidate division KSB1 bacterium]|nr:prolyl oligopeptidase family serine peptidase [candidate division KSB1 bacterium]